MTDPNMSLLGRGGWPRRGWLSSQRGSHSFQNGRLAHIPLVGEPEDEPKADQNGGDIAERRNGEDGQPLLVHDAER